MMRHLRRAAVLIAVWACGCSRQDVIVEHVKLDPAKGAFELGRSVVTTFQNANAGKQPYRPRVKDLTGEHVVIKGGGRMFMNICRNADVETVSEEEFYTLGTVIEPEPVRLQYDVDWLDRDGDGQSDMAIVPTDHDSLAMLTGYVNFDEVRGFFHETLGDRSRATTTPTVVAFFAEVAVGCEPLGNGRVGISVPVTVADNAAYLATSDMFMVLRDAIFAAGIELGANPGVAAHEFSHRVFQQNVFGATPEGFRLLVKRYLGSQEQRDALCKEEPGVEEDQRICPITDVMLRGVDEGTADIFAYVFTGAPDFHFGRSMPDSDDTSPSEDRLRDLSGDPGTEEEIALYGDAIRGDAMSGLLHYYRLGTLWSRAFYRGIADALTGAAPSDEAVRLELARRRHAPALLRALGRLGEDLVVNFRFDPRQLMRRYIEEVVREPDGSTNDVVRTAVCQALCDRFGLLDVNAVNAAAPQCAGIDGTNAEANGTFACTI